MPKRPTVAELFAPGGAIERMLPGYEPRPQQREMALAVERALAEKRHAMIEAGTGTGKSFGYLFALVLHALETKEPVVVSSSTHVLQDQLIRKDIPFVARVLAESGTEFKAAEVKGMGAYACRLALEEAVPALPEMGGDAMATLGKWAETAAEGTRSEAPAVAAELWEEIRADRDTCTGKECRFFETCFFYRARARVAESHVLVANHSLVFADLAVKQEGGKVLPRYSALVLDEAHNVEDAATDFLGSSVNPRGIDITLHRLYRVHDGKAQGALPALGARLEEMKLTSARRRRFEEMLSNVIYPEIEAAGQSLKAAFAEIDFAVDTLLKRQDEARGQAATNGRRRPLRLTTKLLQDPLIEPARVAAHQLASTLELAANKTADLVSFLEIGEDLLNTREFVTARAACGTLRERSLDLKDFFDPISGAGEAVKWIQPVKTRKHEYLMLNAAPLDVAPHLEQRLFKPLDTALLTSATLAVNRDFDFMRTRLGLGGELAPRTDTLLLDSPFPYASNVVVGVPRDLPEPSDRKHLHEAARFLWRALKVSGGRSLVLFNSWSTLMQSWRLLEPHAEKLGFRLLRQGQPGMSKNALIELFRSDIASVLMATTSYREGIDVPGEALTSLVLFRLPFPVPDEPVQEARMERIEQEGGSSFNDYELPAAVIAFKQAFGRLIRSHTDYGIFLCLDKRVLTKRYGGNFLRSLPKCELVAGTSHEVLDRARSFLGDRKSSSVL